jgi:hypothetical protein
MSPLIQERTRADLRVAQTRGRLGRCPTALQAGTRQLAVPRSEEQTVAVQAIGMLMGLSTPTRDASVRQALSASSPDIPSYHERAQHAKKVTRAKTGGQNPRQSQKAPTASCATPSTPKRVDAGQVPVWRRT